MSGLDPYVSQHGILGEFGAIYLTLAPLDIKI
jgi:hypothetical protein